MFRLPTRNHPSALVEVAGSVMLATDIFALLEKAFEVEKATNSPWTWIALTRSWSWDIIWKIALIGALLLVVHALYYIAQAIRDFHTDWINTRNEDSLERFKQRATLGGLGYGHRMRTDLHSTAYQRYMRPGTSQEERGNIMQAYADTPLARADNPLG